ncbi:MAG: hypothetical protein N2688_01740 [Burkholderiaceae bacterium]|nr:hypothetical protein [Burkholderiaceae bacterium]
MTLSTLSVKLVGDIAQFQADMRRAGEVVERTARDMQGRFGAVAATLRGIGAGVTAAFAAVGAIAAFVGQVNRGLLAIKDLSEATGASIENVSALENVARNAGGSLDDVAGVLVKFNAALKEAGSNEQIAELFRQLGLDAAELRRQDPALALRETAVALARFADDGNKARAVQELFGRSVREAGPLLRELAEQTQFAGTVTAEQVAQADRLNKEFAQLRRNVEDLSRVFAGQLVPALNRAFELLREGGLAALFSGGERGAAEREVRAYANAVELLGRQLEIWSAREKAGIDGAAQRVREIRGQLEDMMRKSAQASERLKQLYAPATPATPDERPSLTVPEPARRAPRAATERAPKLVAPAIDPATVDAIRALEQTDAARIAALTAQLQELYRLRAESGGAPAVVEAIERTRQALEALDPAAQQAAEANKRIESLLAATDTAKLQRAQQDVELLRGALERASDPVQIRMLNEALWQTYEALGALPQAAEDAAHKMQKLAEQAAERIEDVLGSGLADILRGRFDNILQSFADMLTQMVARAAAADLMNALFGKGQGGNLAALATAIFGGFRAEGGPVSAGRAYIVGERGPELFVPRSSGTIEPNHKLRRSGDGVAITINVNATGGNADGFRSSARQMAVDISRRLARVRAVA